MKYYMIGLSLIVLGFLALAGWMMYLDKPNWGWCIFCALIIGTISYKRESNG